MSDVKYGLANPHRKVKVSLPLEPVTEHRLEDGGCCWLLIVDEAGCRKTYVVNYAVKRHGLFLKAKTYLGGRELSINQRYVVRREEVRVWEERTIHSNPNYVSPLHRAFISHPEVTELESSGAWSGGRGMKQLFIEIDESTHG